MIDQEYSPFLKWDLFDPVEDDSRSPIFNSLVSMVRDGYNFDANLLSKSSDLLSWSSWRLKPENNIFDYLKSIGQNPSETVPMFVDSITVLLFSSHPSIVKDTLAMVNRSLSDCSLQDELDIFSSKLIPSILSTPHLQEFSIITDKDILKNIIAILQKRINLSAPFILDHIQTSFNTDPQSFRDVILHEVMIPIEPSLVQISRNCHAMTWKDEFTAIFYFLSDIFMLSAYHQPTLDFIGSSHLPMVFQSFLTEVEHDETNRHNLWRMYEIIRTRKTDEAYIQHRGRLFLQTLKQEGFEVGLEQTLLPEISTDDGKRKRFYSFIILKSLGVNSCWPH